MRHVCMMSGGVASWCAARRVVDEQGTDGVTLLFCDTGIEDQDTYRFLHAGAEDLGLPLTTVADGRTPWQVFADEGMIGNDRSALCSRVLKREPARRWVDANCDPTATIVLGLTWEEAHRLPGAERGWAPWTVRAPMCEEAWLFKADMLALAAAAGLPEQRLYKLGFPHANCGGFCVRAGQAHFRHLLRVLPERYAEHEAQEEALRRVIGKDVSILKDRTGGRTRPLTLRELRARDERQQSFDWGGCGCFVDKEE